MKKYKIGDKVNWTGQKYKRVGEVVQIIEPYIRYGKWQDILRDMKKRGCSLSGISPDIKFSKPHRKNESYFVAVEVESKTSKKRKSIIYYPKVESLRKVRSDEGTIKPSCFDISMNKGLNRYNGIKQGGKL